MCIRIIETCMLMSRCPARGTILTFDKCQLVHYVQGHTLLSTSRDEFVDYADIPDILKVQEIREEGTSHII